MPAGAGGRTGIPRMSPPHLRDTGSQGPSPCCAGDGGSQAGPWPWHSQRSPGTQGLSPRQRHLAARLQCPLLWWHLTMGLGERGQAVSPCHRAHVPREGAVPSPLVPPHSARSPGVTSCVESFDATPQWQVPWCHPTSHSGTFPSATSQCQVPLMSPTVLGPPVPPHSLQCQVPQCHPTLLGPLVPTHSPQYQVPQCHVLITPQ